MGFYSLRFGLVPLLRGHFWVGGGLALEVTVHVWARD